MAMPDKFCVKLKNQKNLELFFTGRIFFTKNSLNIWSFQAILCKKKKWIVAIFKFANLQNSILFDVSWLLFPNLDYISNTPHKIKQITCFLQASFFKCYGVCVISHCFAFKEWEIPKPKSLISEFLKKIISLKWWFIDYGVLETFEGVLTVKHWKH